MEIYSSKYKKLLVLTNKPELRNTFTLFGFAYFTTVPLLICELIPDKNKKS